jgi:uncharacterized protein
MTHQVEGGPGSGTDPRPAPEDPLAVDSWARVGRISRVQVYPLKSATAPPAGAVALDRNGAVGDRWFTVTDPEGRPVTAEQAPELRSVVALLAMDGGLVLTVPGAPASVRGERADEALSDLVGRTVRVVPADRSAARLDAPVHLVSVQALDAARRGEHATADCACSLEEPRANLLVDLTGALGRPARKAGAAGYEAALVGRRLRIGGAELEVTRAPDHCLGVYADVAVPGAVRPGDTVEMLAPAEQAAEQPAKVAAEAAEAVTAEGDVVIDLRDPKPATKRGRRHDPAASGREQRTPAAG